MSERLAMLERLERTAKQPVDLLVIGGGSNGVAIARDAAMRGLRVALVEKADFGYGTVSRSTRLIHGGLRYLELLEFGLVRESLREREILLRTAPHLVHPLAFVTPVYQDSPVGLFKLRLGMWLYDMLSWDKSMPRHKFLTAPEAKSAEPLLRDDGLLGAFVYYDGHVPMPERLCLEAAQQAASYGAIVLNYFQALRVSKQGNGYIISCRDELTGKTHRLQARSIVNATGPWADEVNTSLFHPVALDENIPNSAVEDKGPPPSTPSMPRRLRRTKGIHMLVPRISDRAVVMLAEQDGRLFFAIPWGNFTYIGTTDTDFSGDLDRVQAESAEVDYLITETQRVFPEADLHEVYLTTAGVRPLVKDPKARHEGQVSRKHLVHHHEKEGFRGYFSVFGGKITNMRSVAEETIDKVIRSLNISAKPCTTRQALFPGAIHPNMEQLKIELQKDAASIGIATDTVTNLVDLYGSNAGAVLRLALERPDLAERIVPDGPDIWAQLEYGMQHEWIQTTSDFLLRRTAIGFAPGMAVDVAPDVAHRIGEARQRETQEIKKDVAFYERTVDLMVGSLAATSKQNVELQRNIPS